jgi:uncharacterized protein
MKKIFSIFLLLLITTAVFSQHESDPESLLKGRPAKEVLVTDSTATLTPDQLRALEDKLDAFNDSTSTQIAVVIIPSLNGNDIADYNVKLFRAWGVGTKEHNNGVLLLIAKEDHKLNITTGYGVEGALPDITCKEIIDEIIVPKIKGDDYYRGIDEGTDAIMQAVKGEYTAPEGNSTPHKHSLIVRILFWIIGIIVLLILLKTGLLWPVLNIASSIVFSSGGSSSGGFGGFGGGSSGGGGASGSW